MFAVGMAFGVAIAMTILFVVQVNKLIRTGICYSVYNHLIIFVLLKLRVILKNTTGIESWIVKKVKNRLFYINYIFSLFNIVNFYYKITGIT
jgi:hypothetical protein